MIVGLGGNDALRGLDPAETRRNLDAILAELDRRGIPVLITGMMAPRNMGRDYARSSTPSIPTLPSATAPSSIRSSYRVLLPGLNCCFRTDFTPTPPASR